MLVLSAQVPCGIHVVNTVRNMYEWDAILQHERFSLSQTYIHSAARKYILKSIVGRFMAFLMFETNKQISSKISMLKIISVTCLSSKSFQLLSLSSISSHDMFPAKKTVDYHKLHFLSNFVPVAWLKSYLRKAIKNIKITVFQTRLPTSWSTENIKI